MLKTGRNIPTTEVTKNKMKSSKTSGRSFEHGMQNKRVDFFSSLLELVESLSTDLKISREVTDREDSPLRKREKSTLYLRVILGMYCHPSHPYWFHHETESDMKLVFISSSVSRTSH